MHGLAGRKEAAIRLATWLLLHTRYKYGTATKTSKVPLRFTAWGEPRRAALFFMTRNGASPAPPPSIMLHLKLPRHTLPQFRVPLPDDGDDELHALWCSALITDSAEHCNFLGERAKAREIAEAPNVNCASLCLLQYGDTPLHTAARYGHAGVARILISALCNPNLQNKVTIHLQPATAAPPHFPARLRTFCEFAHSGRQNCAWVKLVRRC